jgi:uncharacterized membrane protein
MKIKTISIVLGLLLLIVGILLVVLKPDSPIAYYVSLMGMGGYLFAAGLSSTVMSKMFYTDTSPASAARNKMVRMFEIVVYSFIGIVMVVTLILTFTLLK